MIFTQITPFAIRAFLTLPNHAFDRKLGNVVDQNGHLERPLGGQWWLDRAVITPFKVVLAPCEPRASCSAAPEPREPGRVCEVRERGVGAKRW